MGVVLLGTQAPESFFLRRTAAQHDIHVLHRKTIGDRSVIKFCERQGVSMADQLNQVRFVDIAGDASCAAWRGVR